MPNVPFSTGKTDYRLLRSALPNQQKDQGEIWTRKNSDGIRKAVGYTDLRSAAGAHSAKSINWSGVKASQFDLKVSVKLADAEQKLTLTSDGKQQVFVLPSKNDAGLSSANDGTMELEFKLAPGSTPVHPFWELKDSINNLTAGKITDSTVAAGNAKFKRAFSLANGGDGELHGQSESIRRSLRQGVTSPAPSTNNRKTPTSLDTPQNGLNSPAVPSIQRKGLEGGNNRCYFNALYQLIHGTPLLEGIENETKKHPSAEVKAFGKALRALGRVYKRADNDVVNAQYVINKLASLEGIESSIQAGQRQDSEEILTQVLRQWQPSESDTEGRTGFSHPAISEDNSEFGRIQPRSLINATPTAQNYTLEQYLQNQNKAALLTLKEHMFVKINRFPGENQNIDVSKAATLGDKTYQLKAFIRHTGNHYIAYAKQGEDWYELNDSIVQKVDINKTLREAQRQITVAHYQDAVAI